MDLEKNLDQENGDGSINLTVLGLTHCPVCHHLHDGMNMPHPLYEVFSL